MKKLICFFGILLIFTTVTCNSDTDPGTTRIYINFKQNIDQINKSKAINNINLPGNVNQIRVTVYSGKISDSKKIYDNTFEKDVNEATINVISGPARILTIEGLNIFKNPLYRVPRCFSSYRPRP
jgi:hypothetical protein